VEVNIFEHFWLIIYFPTLFDVEVKKYTMKISNLFYFRTLSEESISDFKTENSNV